MSDTVEQVELTELPDESAIASFRQEAEEKDVSIEATYSTSSGAEKRMVISPRGTVVILNDVSEETFNQSTSAADIAEYVRQ